MKWAILLKTEAKSWYCSQLIFFSATTIASQLRVQHLSVWQRQKTMRRRKKSEIVKCNRIRLTASVLLHIFKLVQDRLSLTKINCLLSTSAPTRKNNQSFSVCKANDWWWWWFNVCKGFYVGLRRIYNISFNWHLILRRGNLKFIAQIRIYIIW